MAVAVTKNATSEADEAQLIVASNAMLCSMQHKPDKLPPGTTRCILNSISWLSPVEDDFYIRGKVA